MEDENKVEEVLEETSEDIQEDQENVQLEELFAEYNVIETIKPVLNAMKDVIEIHDKSINIISKNLDSQNERLTIIEQFTKLFTKVVIGLGLVEIISIILISIFK